MVKLELRSEKLQEAETSRNYNW